MTPINGSYDFDHPHGRRYIKNDTPGCFPEKLSLQQGIFGYERAHNLNGVIYIMNTSRKTYPGDSGSSENRRTFQFLISLWDSYNASPHTCIQYIPTGIGFKSS